MKNVKNYKLLCENNAYPFKQILYLSYNGFISLTYFKVDDCKS